MRYVEARIVNYMHDKTYRIYVTDSIHYINDNIANVIGGKSLDMRYLDVITPVKYPNRTADEVITSIKSKLKNIGQTE